MRHLFWLSPPWERLMPSESVLFGSDLILSYLVLYATNHWVSVFASWRLEALAVKIGWVDFNDMWLACLWHSILGCILTICSMIHFQVPVLGSSLEMKMWLDALQDLLKGHVVLCLAGYLSLFLNLFCFFPFYCCYRMRYSWASSYCLFSLSICCYRIRYFWAPSFVFCLMLQPKRVGWLMG